MNSELPHSVSESGHSPQDDETAEAESCVDPDPAVAAVGHYVLLERAREQLAAWLVEEPGRFYCRIDRIDGAVQIELRNVNWGLFGRSGVEADEPTAILSALERAKGGR